MTLDGIELPDDLLWVDEFDWNPVAQDIERSLTGALMVQEQAKLYGRPITLTGGDEAGWVTRATVLELMALAEVPSKIMKLTFVDGRVFLVRFNYQTNGVVSSYQIIKSAAPALNDLYMITVKLMSLP